MNFHLNERSAGIDLLRCLSVLLVIFSHYGALGGFPLGGTHGVAIFFMVSGYCMSYSMEGRNGQEFLAARFWRLVPTLIICATITQVFEVSLDHVRPDRGQSLMVYGANILCLPAGNLICDFFYDFVKGHAISYNWVDGAYWSLLVEIRFYLLLWVIYYVIKLKTPIFVIATLGVLSLLDLEWSKISKSNDFFMYMPFFAFGMASSTFFQKKDYGVLLMAYSLVIFLFVSFVGANSISMGLNQSNVLSYTSCFVIYLGCMTLYRSGRNKIVSYIGILSYPLYLLHQDIGLILIKLSDGVPTWVSIVVAFGVVFFLAGIVNAVVERYQTIFREQLFCVSQIAAFGKK